MDKKISTNPQRKKISSVILNNHLSIEQLIPFENHPSARGLMKNGNEEIKIENLCYKYILEENKFNSDNQNINSYTNFTLSLNPIENKLYQNEIYYEKNNYCSKDINYDNIEIKKKSTFTEKEEQFDKEIINSIKNNEKSDAIINKFQNFVNIKKNECV